jgi:hypothetical protein
MDDVAISKYCVGYYWSVAHLANNGPFTEERYRRPRSPSVVYIPSRPNPVLTYNVVCPVNSMGVSVTPASMSSVSLVPRCTCVEEDQFQSLQSQPYNAALNGNFADWDLTQENPISGWTSQESWRGQVLPIEYSGQAQLAQGQDISNKGSV